MTLGKIHHLGHFGFGNLMAEYAHHGETLFMHGQHDLKGLRVVETKEALKHMDHKLHRCVVVVQDHHFVQRRTRGFAARLGHHPDVRIPGTLIII